LRAKAGIDTANTTKMNTLFTGESSRIHPVLPTSRLRAAHMFCCVGQQGHLPRLFESHTETALMFGASPCLTTGFNFTTIGNVALFAKAAYFLVVDFTHMVMTELANFAARCALTASALASFTTWGAFGSSLHGWFSSK
jgi:hypothetical protein